MMSADVRTVDRPSSQQVTVRAAMCAICCAALVLAALALPAASAGAAWRRAAVVPRLGPLTQAKVAKTRALGLKLGKRPDVFSKVGDSISESPAFLQGLGCGDWTPGRHADLAATVGFFAARTLPGRSDDCPVVNSFSRHGPAARGLQFSSYALSPGAATYYYPECGSTETPLACDYRVIRPAYAVIMFGTNDALLDIATPESTAENLQHIVTFSRRSGVQPILSTIPPRPDREAKAEAINAATYEMARRRHVPIINLWRALNPLPNRGLSSDNVHPSLFGGPGCTGLCDPNSCRPACQSANFTAAGLRFGYDQRNLLTLRTLEELRAVPIRRR
jgi:GDSL-like Lipase/Acylhydrolase family